LIAASDLVRVVCLVFMSAGLLVVNSAWKTGQVWVRGPTKIGSERCLVTSVLPSLLLLGQAMTLQVPALQSSPPVLMDHDELEAFVDSLIPQALERSQIPGAVFVLVKDREVVFAKGYGYADLERHSTVMAPKTLFRVGSVSKLFTATAVLQLRERGRVSLDTDVNTYLKGFRIGNPIGKPVTLWNLLTHTGGFDDRYIGIAARKEADRTPLGDYLARSMPQCVMPPGELIVSSNHGIALAGYVVEAVSGEPFERVIEENIFKPLGMARSSFLLPEHLVNDLATGYELRGGSLRPVPFDFLNDAPAGGLVTTATDIARFMVAHLQDGQFGDVRILEVESARAMHRRQFSHHSALPGIGYGFWEGFENGRRVLYQTGAARGFMSTLALLPDVGIGIFVAFNRYDFSGVGGVRDDIEHKFLDRYFPAPAPASPAVSRPAGETGMDLYRFAGTYRSCRYSRTTLAKITLLAGVPPEVHVETKGGLMKVGGARYVEVEPLVFRREDGVDLVAFRERNGLITHLFVGVDVLERVPFYQRRSFQIGLALAFVAAFATGCLFLIPKRRRARVASQPSDRLSKIASLLAGLVSLLNLVFLIGVGVVFLRTAPFEFTYGPGPALASILMIPLLTTSLAFVLFVLSMVAWKTRSWSTWTGIRHFAVTFAAFAFSWFLDFWNLLGFRF
jgi:CubicO group peptidase (beta-lactamase class C family)